MLLTNARLPNGSGATGPVDVAIAHGRIAAITPAAGRPGTDMAGALLLPSLVDGHVHLDKTVWGLPWQSNSGAATVRERIENERIGRASLPPVAERGANLLRQMITSGTTALRTHTDIDDAHGLSNFHATMALVARFKGQADIQVVAFPQSGIITRPRVADLLAQALREGADLVGGLDPASIDGDAKAHLDIVFASPSASTAASTFTCMTATPPATPSSATSPSAPLPSACSTASPSATPSASAPSTPPTSPPPPTPWPQPASTS